MHKIMEMGTGADRQIRVSEETGDFKKKVVDYIIEETEVGVAETADPVSEQKQVTGLKSVTRIVP